MAQSDAVSAFTECHGTWVVSDGGANSLTMAFVKTGLAPTIEGQPWSEARTRNQHHSTPNAVITGDGNITASGRIGVTSFYGLTAVTPYEVLTLTGGAAGWATTGVGTKKMLRHTITWTNPAGATQTWTLNYCIVSNVAIDPQGDEGLMAMTFDLVDLENNITVT